jgi:hypothetical protein
VHGVDGLVIGVTATGKRLATVAPPHGTNFNGAALDPGRRRDRLRMERRGDPAA